MLVNKDFLADQMASLKIFVNSHGFLHSNFLVAKAPGYLT